MNDITFQILNPQAAGIDVGSRSHLVAGDQDRDKVREFGVTYRAKYEPQRQLPLRRSDGTMRWPKVFLRPSKVS